MPEDGYDRGRELRLERERARSMRRLREIADALGVPVSYFFERVVPRAGEGESGEDRETAEGGRPKK